MYNDLLQNLNYIEGLYIYGSGEMDQLSPLKETTKEKKDIFQTSIPRKVPLHFIRDTETIKLIQCGELYTLILSTEGNVYTFGCADDGSLGHEESIPAKRVPLKFPAIGISGGDCHGIAYNRENLAFWGRFRNKNGGIGEISYEPTYFNNSHINGEYYKKAISGTNHVIILTEKKNVFAFGNNDSGQIGVSPGKVFHHFQMNKLYEKNVEDIFTGDEYSFLTKYENGSKILKSWGANGNGQLGIGSYQTNIKENSSVYVPTKVIFPGISTISIKKVTGGTGTSICLTEDNRVFVWGLNDFSQLGLQIEDKVIPRPKEIAFFNPYSNPNNIVDDIYARNQYFYAKNNTTNKVYSWGMGDCYILGNRKEKSEPTPFLINHLFFKNLYVNDLALGSAHVVAFLIEKKDMNLNMNMSQQKIIERKKNEISDISKNKPIKRTHDELPDEKKEKEEDFGVLIRVKEEYITLHESDQPKASAKKFTTEKKIIKKEDNFNKIIEEEKEKTNKIENEKNNENDFNILVENNKKENKKSIDKSKTSSTKKTKDSPNKQIKKEENSKSNLRNKEVEKKEKTPLKNSHKMSNSVSKEKDKKDDYEKIEIDKNEEEEMKKKHQSKNKKKKSYPKKEIRSEKNDKEKNEEKDNKKEKGKEKAPLKNSNKKKSVTKNEKDNNRDKEENVEKKSDKKEKDSYSRTRKSISSSKEKEKSEEKYNKIEDKKGKNTKKSTKSKNMKYPKEEDDEYSDDNDDKNIDKEEKKSKKTSSQSKQNKNKKKEGYEESKNSQRNSENNNNYSKKKNSNSKKKTKTPNKKEDSKSKRKNSTEKSKMKSKSKSKDKNRKRK